MGVLALKLRDYSFIDIPPVVFYQLAKCLDATYTKPKIKQIFTEKMARYTETYKRDYDTLRIVANDPTTPAEKRAEIEARIARGYASHNERAVDERAVRRTMLREIIAGMRPAEPAQPEHPQQEAI